MDDLFAELALAFGPEVKQEPEDEEDNSNVSPVGDDDTHDDGQAAGDVKGSCAKPKAGAKKRILTRRDSLFAYIVWFQYCLIMIRFIPQVFRTGYYVFFPCPPA